jgi:tetratricopeptide (TPR) repeat protein
MIAKIAKEISNLPYFFAKQAPHVIRILLLLAPLMLLGVGFAQKADEDSIMVLLKYAKDYYIEGEYPAVIIILGGILNDLEGSSISEAHTYLAVSYVAVGDRTAAKEHFKKALRFGHKLILDPAVVSREAINIFDKTKREVAGEAAMCSCFLPGSGQMMKGDNRKGQIIMAASAVTAITSILSWTITQEKGQTYWNLGADETGKLEQTYNEYNKWYGRSLLVTTSFLCVYLYGIIDAFVYDAGHSSTFTRSMKSGLILEPSSKGISISYIVDF